MQTITLKFSGEQKVYHDYFKPYLCTSDIEVPKMYNQGFNSFRFVGGEPNFIGVNTPRILQRETNNYLIYGCDIQIIRSDKSTVSGRYNLTINKITGGERETFDFD